MSESQAQPLPVVVPNTTHTVKNIYQRIIEVQKKVLSVEKKENVKMYENDKGYKAVSHDDVALLLHTPLAEAGIVLLPTVTEYTVSEFEIDKWDKYEKKTKKQKWYRTDLKINVKWINADDPKDFIESNGGAYALDTSDKSFAKAYSLALKIVLLKVHLLESKDEEEKRTFEGDEPPPKQQPKTNPQASQQKPPAQAGGNPQSKPPVQNHAPGALSQDQLKRLYAIGMPRGWSSEYLRLKVYMMYKKTPSQLDFKQYEALCANFESRAFSAKDKAELDHLRKGLAPDVYEKVVGKKPPQTDTPQQHPDYENYPQ